MPFLSTSVRMWRELSLFAFIVTFAIALDLLFSMFGLPRFAALTLTLFVAMAVYASVRQWLLSRTVGMRVASNERLFEQLFLATREVENHPEQAGQALSRLLEELFEPVEVTLVDTVVSSAHAVDDGSAMLVPVPAVEGGSPSGQSTSILLRRAQQGWRRFTSDDARLADRIGEQLRRNIAFDQAVERGRGEERRRLAQDLHDDIGARLLTLMYKAQSPELEDYARHTLQDLKTLTRGLAASKQPLAHALAEWKSDIAQRLTAAQIVLKWTAAQDVDVVLSMVQWSALTRVLRELVTNVITHTKARSIEIDVSLVKDKLVITIADDGMGSAPERWSPGLGLGGIRKRVRQLGGEVTWQERLPRGICCRISVERFSAPN